MHKTIRREAPPPWAEAKAGDRLSLLFGSDSAFERYLGFKAGKIPADRCNR